MQNKYTKHSPNIDLSGGSVLFFLGTYSMMADLTKKESEKSATVRLAIMDGLIHIGFYVGNAMASPIRNNLGIKYNFSMGLLFAVISAAYTMIFIKESLVKESNKDKENHFINKKGKYTEIR